MGSLFKESVINGIISYLEEPMVIYVLIEERYHDNGIIIGVFKSREETLEGFKKFRHDVDNKIIEVYHHWTRDPENSQKCLEGLKTNDEYSLNGPHSDDNYIIRKFELGEVNPQYC